jgi:hypothetical protein
MWYYLNQFDAQSPREDVLVNLEAGETDERSLMGAAQESEGALARRVRAMRTRFFSRPAQPAQERPLKQTRPSVR